MPISGWAFVCVVMVAPAESSPQRTILCMGTLDTRTGRSPVAEAAIYASMGMLRPPGARRATALAMAGHTAGEIGREPVGGQIGNLSCKGQDAGEYRIPGHLVRIVWPCGPWTMMSIVAGRGHAGLIRLTITLGGVFR
jgi:hypothetical protein